MANVLYIKANAKKEGQSRTFKISDAFIEAYQKLNPADEVTTLDLYQENIGFLPIDELAQLHTPKEGEGKDNPILKYAYQFRDADKIVISAPFWNLSFPAILKAYLDYVTVSGITFRYTATGPEGLVKSDKVVYFTSRGGNYLAEPLSNLEMGARYLHTLLSFLGVKDFKTISADGLDIIGNDAEAIVNQTIKEALDAVKTF